MNNIKRIFIVGRMGSGKGLLAKALADKLGWQFVDANLSLERVIGRSLNEILGSQGIEHFRECESEILSHYLRQENIVVTTNDGMVASEKNRKLLSSEYVIYLKVDTASQLDRMSSDKDFLLPVADKKAFLEKLNHAYDHFFDEVATLTIDSEPVINGDIGKSIHADVSKVMQSLKS